MRKICKECANYDHKNLKHTKACGNCVTEHYKDGTESDPSNWRALPQTNADRIRAMSDEQLAKFLEEASWICANQVCRKCPLSTGTDICKSVEEWLKQPVKEIDNG